MDENSTVVPTQGIPVELQDVNTTELPLDMQFNSAHVISIVGYSFLFVVSSICNCSVMLILIRRYKKTKSRVNLLLIHLAIADLLVTFLMMPLEIGWAATVMWIAGDILCRFFMFFRIFGLFLSSNILICISLDRFYAIVCPLSSGKAIRNMKIMLWTAWIVSILSAAPQVYIFHVASHPVHTWYTQCVTFGSFPSDAWEKAYILFSMVMIYFLPLTMIVVTYSIILFTIYRKSKAETGNQSGDGLRRSGAGVLNRARARTLKMTVVIVLVFIFCWTPYYIITLLFISDKEYFQKIDQQVQNTLFIFACINSVMDPIVYGYFNLRNKNNRNQNMAPAVQGFRSRMDTSMAGSNSRLETIGTTTTTSNPTIEFKGQNNLPLPTVNRNRQNGGNQTNEAVGSAGLNGVNNHIELRRLNPKEEELEDVEKEELI